MKAFYSLLGSLIIILALLASCGGNSSNGFSAPDGSTIVINPGDFTVTDAGSTTTTRTHYFSIVVKDSSGAPLNKAKINIFFPWAVPNPPAVVQLYDGSTAVNSPFDAFTDSFGVYNLRFDYQSGGGLAYFGNLEVRSGTAFQSIIITINAQ